MKALRKLAAGPGHVALVDVPEPEPSQGQVLVRVERAGICGTDLHILQGHFGKVRPPVTLGHELSGTIASVGPGVTGWTPGDRVTVESEASTCGTCTYCRQGRTQLCADRLALGYGVDGGFAELVAVRHTALHRLPETIGFSEGALCEPLSVAVHAVMERSRLQQGDTALVAGPGPIGLLVLQVAQAAGARVVQSGVAADRDRLEKARALGAVETVASDRESLHETIVKLTGGPGVSTAFECSGNPAALEDCIRSVRAGGEVILVGLAGRPIHVDVDTLTLKEIGLKGAFVHAHETWKRAVALMESGRVNLKALISAEFPLERWEEAFRQVYTGRGIKVLLRP